MAWIFLARILICLPFLNDNSLPILVGSKNVTCRFFLASFLSISEKIKIFELKITKNYNIQVVYLIYIEAIINIFPDDRPKLTLSLYNTLNLLSQYVWQPQLYHRTPAEKCIKNIWLSIKNCDYFWEKDKVK